MNKPLIEYLNNVLDIAGSLINEIDQTDFDRMEETGDVPLGTGQKLRDDAQEVICDTNEFIAALQAGLVIVVGESK